MRLNSHLCDGDGNYIFRFMQKKPYSPPILKGFQKKSRLEELKTVLAGLLR